MAISIASSGDVGGICGYTQSGSTIKNCYSNGVTAKGGTNDYIGGICGQNYKGTISNCYYGKGRMYGISDASEDMGVGYTYSTDSQSNTTSVSDSELKTGEICYKLNADRTGDDTVWFQTLLSEDQSAVDKRPVFNSTHSKVYQNGSEYQNVMLKNDYYQIYSVDDLKYFKLITDAKPNANAILISDINLGSFGFWKPIGSSGKPYTGTFDGNGHTIRCLAISASGDNFGLFGTVQDGTVKNLTVQGIINQSQNDTCNNVGGIVGCIKGSASLTNLVSKVSIKGYYDSNVGGIVGKCDESNDGITVNRCIYDENIDISNGCQNVGGIVGYADKNTTISNCACLGDVKASLRVGGILGYVESSNFGGLYNCFVTGTIIGDSSDGVIIGHAFNNVTTNIENNYYLNGNRAVGYNKYLEEGAEKMTQSDFESGKVAYLLNQKESNIWGRDGKDIVIIGDGQKPVHQVTFVYSNNNIDNILAYSDINGKVQLPALSNDSEFELQYNGNSFNGENITEDMSVSIIEKYCASIGNNKYASFEKALAAANASEAANVTIKLLSDIPSSGITADQSVNLTDAGHNLTLDLAGNNLDLGDKALIVNNGTLTVDDSVGTGDSGGSIKSTKLNTIKVNNDKRLVVKGGTVENKNSTSAYGSAIYACSDDYKINKDTPETAYQVIIEDDAIIKADQRAISLYKSSVKVKGGKISGTNAIYGDSVNITGGDLYGTRHCVDIPQGCKGWVLITGGKLEANERVVSSWQTVVEIKGGTFREHNARFPVELYTYSTNKKLITIDGGTFESGLDCSSYEDASLTLGDVLSEGFMYYKADGTALTQDELGSGSYSGTLTAAGDLNALITSVNNDLNDGKYNDTQYTTASIDKLRKALIDAAKINASGNSSLTEKLNAYQALVEASTVDVGGLVPAARFIKVICGDSGSSRGSYSGSGWYAVGDTVTLKAAVNAGYTFKGWTTANTYNSESAVTTSKHSFEVTADSADTYYIWFDTKGYTVSLDTTAGGGTASIEPSKTDYSYGEQVTFTATADDKYEFAGWVNEYGDTVSTESEYTFAVIGKCTLTPKFIKVKNDDETPITYVTVSFYHQTGKLISSQKVESGLGTISEPVSPTKGGFTFNGWTDEEDGITPITYLAEYTFTQNTNLYPVFIKDEVTYSLTVDGAVYGEENYEPQTRVTVSAEEPAADQVFYGWMNNNGEYVSYDSVYSFIIVGNTVLNAVYVEREVAAETEKPASITINAPTYTVLSGVDGYKMTFYFNYYLPDKCTLVDIRTLKVKDANLVTEEITFDTENASMYSVFDKLGVSGQFYYSKSNYNNVSHSVCGYMVYTDKEGNRQTVYSSTLYGSMNS